MSMSAMDVVVCAYVATFVCVLIVEFAPWRRVARIAALSALALVSIGGAAWAYAAYYTRAEWPELIATRPADDDAGSSTEVGRRGGEIDTESDGAAGNEAGGGAKRGSGDTNVRAQPSVARAGEVKLAQMLGLAGRGDENDNSGVVRDCDVCPPLIAVPPGNATIGASDSDADATAAERPAQSVRMWPGFYISAAPVTAASFKQFLRETYRTERKCSVETAALAKPEGTLALKIVPIVSASCISPADADAYVTWLTGRTGKRFRLPTAVEWEYAARVLPQPGLQTGSVAEIVADCWQTVLPRLGHEKLAAHTAERDCEGRMLKGAAATEPARWHRFSARRQIDVLYAGATTGFRVMRALDGRR